MEVSSRNIGCDLADDTAIVTALESDNQLLCNGFLKWSSWAGLIVRADKWSVLRMKMSKTESVQCQPYVTINSEIVCPTRNYLWQCYLFRKGLQFQHELQSRERQFNENHLWLYQQNRCFTNSSLKQNRDMPKILLLENQMAFIY